MEEQSKDYHISVIKTTISNVFADMCISREIDVSEWVDILREITDRHEEVIKNQIED